MHAEILFTYWACLTILYKYYLWSKSTDVLAGRSWWLRLWTGNYEEAATISIFSLRIQTVFASTPLLASTASANASHNLRYYLGIYVAISATTVILGTLRYFFVYTGAIRASRRLFDKLSYTILRTPLRWMDTVPLGRILNRFTADFNVVDARLANDIGFGANNVFRLIGVIVAG